MTTPQPPEPKSSAPRLIGIYRYSAAEFLVALVLLFIGIVFVEQLDRGKDIEAMLLTLVLVSGVLAVGQRRRTLVLGMVLALPAVAGKWVNHYWPELLPVEFFLVAGLVFLVFLIWQFLRFILRTPRVNSEVMCAGISIYLLLGLMWMFAYLLVARAVPDAFAFNTGPAPSHSMNGFTAYYFSFGTLTTVGFGDVTPVSNGARALAVMESMTGTLYVAVLISRLVAMYSSEGRQSGGQNH